MRPNEHGKVITYVSVYTVQRLNNRYSRTLKNRNMENILHKNTGFILYIDILGYSDIIKSKNEEDIACLRNFIISLQPEYLPLSHLFDECDKNSFHIKYFSDNIFIFYQSVNFSLSVFIGMCYLANYIQSKGISNGYLTRGSLSFGEVEYNRKILFGESIIDITDEEKLNLSPSVCLSSKLRNILENSNLTNRYDLLSPFGYYAQVKEYEELCLLGISRMIERLNKTKNVDENIVKKYEWLIKEFNRYFNLKKKKKLTRLPSSIYRIEDDTNVAVWG